MTLALKTGDSVVIDGAVYRMLHKALSGQLCFQNWENGNVLQLSEEDLQRKYLAGNTTFGVPSPLQSKSGAKNDVNSLQREYLGLDFGSLRPDQQAEARRCKAYVDAVMQEGRPARRAETWPPLIDATARATSDARKPSWQTVSRWLRRYLASRCDIRSLISGNASKGRRRVVRSPEEQKVLSDTLNLWLTEEQPTKQWVYDQVEAAYANARREIIGATQWKIPCRATVYRMLDDIDLYERVRRREGKRAADYLFNTVGPGKPAAFRLEVVEIDHTRADVWVIDHVTGYLLGRPWITIAIDRYTRMIVGVYIGFESPSTHSVMQCLHNMILPKLEMLESMGLRGPWNPFGVPVMVVVDNAKEFISDAMRDAAAVLGITIAQQPVNRPEFKGIVERAMRTIKESGLTWMPGKVRVFAKDSRGYDPTKFACITLDEFRKCFFQWLIYEYTHSTHTGIMDAPGRRWAEQVERHPVFPPNHVSDLNAVLGLRKTGIIGRRGLRFRNLFFQSPDLTAIRQDPRLSNAVQFTVNPGNLAFIRVTHPADQKSIIVPAAFSEYANGLTLYQHDLIRAFTLKRNRSYENQADLVEGRRLLREASLSLLARNRTKNRSRVTRGLGLGVTQSKDEMARMLLEADRDPMLNSVVAQDMADEQSATKPDLMQGESEGHPEAETPVLIKKSTKAKRPSGKRKNAARPNVAAAPKTPRTTSRLHPTGDPISDDDDDLGALDVAERPVGRRFGPHDSK